MNFDRHIWVMMLILAPLNVLIFWHRSKPIIRQHPELEAGYRKLFLGFTFWMSLPWLVMGLGCELGGVPLFIAFLFPATGGPFVWAFWVVVYGLFLLLLYWAVWGGGAEVLIRYPGITNFQTDSARRMKWYLGGTAVWGVVWTTCFLLWLAQ